MAKGGSIQEVSIDGRVFAATEDSNSERGLGGNKADQKPNGNGTARTILTPTLWKQVVDVEIDNERDDQKFLQDLINRGNNVEIVISYIDADYVGEGLPAGDEELMVDTKEAKATLTLSGPGVLTKQ